MQVNSGVFAVGGESGKIYLFNTNTYASIGNLIGHTSNVDVFALLSNGFLVSGSEDYSVRIWNVTSGTQFSSIATPIGSEEVWCLGQFSNGNLMIGGWGAIEMSEYNVATSLPSLVTSWPNFFPSGGFCPNMQTFGNIFAISSGSNYIYLYNQTTSTVYMNLSTPSATDYVRGLQFLSSKKMLMFDKITHIS